jgi:predicted dehydrogenase
MAKIRFGIVGTGWRALFFFRIARARPDLFEVVGAVTRRRERVITLADEYGIRGFTALDRLLAEKPSFVVTSVPWGINPDLLRDLARHGMPALSETPPAPDIESMTALYADLKRLGGKVQVAEEYHRRPMHVSQAAVAASGKLGRITHAQVSVGHGYHGISLMRRFLGIGSQAARITARAFKAPIVDGGGREKPPEKETVRDSVQEIYIFDYGDRSGVIDFTGDQYSFLIRDERVLLRGERGELFNDSYVRLLDPRTPVRQKLIRHHDNLLNGVALLGIQAGEEWVYRNPYAPAPLTDDEIAIADCLVAMDEFARTGKQFYPVEEGMQDHYLYILAQRAAKQDGAIEAPTQPWAWE